MLGESVCVCAVSGFAILKKTVSQSLDEKVTSELRPQGYMRAFHADIWNKSLMGKRKNKYKRPEQNCGAFEKQQERGTAQLVIVRNEVGIYLYTQSIRLVQK